MGHGARGKIRTVLITPCSMPHAPCFLMSQTFDPYAEWLGITPQEQPPDHYRLLGIPRYESDQKVIAAAADQRTAYLRGFQSGEHAASAQQLLNQVSTASVCLLSAGAKSRYDAQLQAKLQSAASPTSASPSAAAQSSAAAPPKPVPTFVPPSAGNAMAPMTPQTAAPDITLGPAPQSAPQITPKSPSAAAPKIAARPSAYRAPDAPPPEPRTSGTGIPLIPFLIMSTLVIVSLCGLILFVQYRKSHVVREPEGPPAIELPQEDGKSIAGARVIVREDVAAQGEDGNILLEVRKAKVQGATIAVESIEAIDWTSDIESVSWDILVSKPGIFLFDVTYAAADSAAGGAIKITVNQRRVFFRIRNTNGWESFVTDPGNGGFTITRGGRYSLVVTPHEMPDKSRLMKLKSIRLRKAATGAR